MINGLKVNQTNDDFPKELEKIATSLKKESNRTWAIVALIQEILTTFENTYDAYIHKGFPHIKDKWENYGFKIGEQIRIKTLQDEWQATFSGIAEDGALLSKPDGETMKLYSEEN